MAGRILGQAFVERFATLTAPVSEAERASTATSEGLAKLYLEIRGKEGPAFYAANVVAASAWPM